MLSPRFVLCALGLGLASIGAASDCVIEKGSVLRVDLGDQAPNSPKPDMELKGTLARPVYGGRCQAIPEGAHLRTTIQTVEKKRSGNAVAGWFRRLSGAPAPPPEVTLRSLDVEIPGQGWVPVQGDFVRLSRERYREAGGKKTAKIEKRRVLVLAVKQPLHTAARTDDLPAAQATLVAGTSLQVDVISALTSKTNRTGDVIRARVAAPVMVAGRVAIPEGTIIEGTVAQARRAARPYRAGRMRLNFKALVLPGGERLEAPMTPAAGGFSGATKLDAEGGFTGGALDKKRGLLNAGLAYLTGKIIDDLFEEGAKGALNATAAGSATAARYIGLGVGVFIFLMHRGREVAVPEQTELTLTLTRDAHLP